MADLTPEAIAELRKLPLHAPRPLFYYDPQERLWDALPALLDMAERCAKAEAEWARLVRLEQANDRG